MTLAIYKWRNWSFIVHVAEQHQFPVHKLVVGHFLCVFAIQVQLQQHRYINAITKGVCHVWHKSAHQFSKSLHLCSKANMINMHKLLALQMDRSLMYTWYNVDANIHFLGRLFSCVQYKLVSLPMKTQTLLFSMKSNEPSLLAIRPCMVLLCQTVSPAALCSRNIDLV